MNNRILIFDTTLRDGEQSPGASLNVYEKLEIARQLEKLNVDMLTLNGSKIYGPKGTGILYRRKGIDLHPIIHGGGQESGLRSGTENVAGIAGFAKALEIAQEKREEENERLIRLRDRLIKGITENIPKSFL